MSDSASAVTAGATDATPCPKCRCVEGILFDGARFASWCECDVGARLRAKAPDFVDQWNHMILHGAKLSAERVARQAQLKVELARERAEAARRREAAESYKRFRRMLEAEAD